jgi:hypothetical protein
LLGAVLLLLFSQAKLYYEVSKACFSLLHNIISFGVQLNRDEAKRNQDWLNSNKMEQPSIEAKHNQDWLNSNKRTIPI